MKRSTTFTHQPFPFSFQNFSLICLSNAYIDLGVNAVPDACASVFDPSSNTDFQEYPSTLAPSDLGLETEQALFANTIQDPELSSLPSNNNTFRMIQPSYDLGSLSSFFGQQTPSPAISTGNRSYRRYSANDGKASSGFSSGLAQYTSSFSDNPEMGNYPSRRWCLGPNLSFCFLFFLFFFFHFHFHPN